MAELSDAEIKTAEKRGAAARAYEPRAVAVHYDRNTKKVVIDLENGATFSFPAHLAQGLEDASDDDLSGVEILGSGFGLHWETLDVDFSVPGLVAGIFGTAAFMARKAGATKSEAKAFAARCNGMKGGRPRQEVAASVLTQKPALPMKGDRSTKEVAASLLARKTALPKRKKRQGIG
jgi:hypothetical protein